METKEEREARLAQREARRVTTKTKTSNFSKYLPNILINILVIVIITLMTLAATFNIDPTFVLEARYWITTAVLFIAYLATHWSYYNSRVRQLRANIENREYIEAQKAEINKVTRTTTWSEHRKAFVSDRNARKKVEAWESHIRKRIDKITRRAKESDRDVENAVISDFQREVYKDRADELKRLQSEIDARRGENRYCQRKQALVRMLAREWIAENINKIRIDYNEVDIQFIENGNVYSGIQKDKQTPRGLYAKDTLGPRVKTFAFTAALTAIGIDTFSGSILWSSWLLLALRLGGLVFNIIGGVSYGDEFYQKLDVWNIDKRVEIAGEFKIWALNNGYATKNAEGETK